MEGFHILFLDMLEAFSVHKFTYVQISCYHYLTKNAKALLLFMLGNYEKTNVWGFWFYDFNTKFKSVSCLQGISEGRYTAMTP